MFENLKTKLTEWLIASAIKNIIPETVGNVFKKALELLKEKATETENILDDWAMEGLVFIFSDEAKIAQITEFVKAKISGNVCECLEYKYGGNEYELLAHSLTEPKAGECEAGAFSAILARVLEVVILIIMENITKEECEG